MIKIKILAAGLAFLVAGCHKKPPPEASQQNAAEPASSAQSPDAASGAVVSGAPPPGAKPLPAPPPPVAARADNYVRANVTGQPDPFLTEQLRTFVTQKHRMPESFAEFAGARLDSVPRPPAGQKWIIDSGTMEVKASPSK